MEIWASWTICHPDIEYESLSSHPALQQAQFVWTLPHMVAIKGDADYVQKVTNRNIQIRIYNYIVLEFFSSVKDPKWIVIDFFHLTRDRLVLVLAQDAAHFQPILFRWKKHVMLNMLCPQKMNPSTVGWCIIDCYILCKIWTIYPVTMPLVHLKVAMACGVGCYRINLLF